MDNSTRQAKRAPVTLKIKFKSETLAQFIERYAVDVSPGGIFIRTKEPLAVGTPMKFEFQLRDATPLITGEGTVVWTRENDPARPNAAPGMGVRFDRLGEGSQPILDKILAEKSKSGAPSSHEPQQRLFTDAPTRVAPSPLVGQLLGESRGKGGGFGDERTDTTPLPKPMPFHSDAEEFPDETFEEATKVRTLEDLIAATAQGGSQAKPRATMVISSPPPPPPAARTAAAPPPAAHHGPSGATPLPAPLPIAPPPEEAAAEADPPTTPIPPPAAMPPPPPAPTRAAPPPPPGAHGAPPALPRTRTPVPPPGGAAELPITDADLEPESETGAFGPSDTVHAPPPVFATPRPAPAPVDVKPAAAAEPMAEAEVAPPPPRKTPPMAPAVEPAAEAAVELPETPAAQAAAPSSIEVAPEPAPAEPAAQAEAAPAEQAAPREKTPLPAPLPEPTPAAAKAPEPERAKPATAAPVARRPMGVPIPPKELTDPNRKHGGLASAQIETAPPGMGIGIIIMAVLFALGLAALVWFFFIRSTPEDVPQTSTDEVPVAAPGTGSAPGSAEPGSAPGSADTPPVRTNPATTELSASVPGAMIEIPAENLSGPSPFVVELEKGEPYSASVTASGYKSAKVGFLGGAKVAPVKLVPMSRILHVASTPPGATVLIDGESSDRKTPADFTLSSRQAAKASLTISLTKGGFAPFEQTITVDDFAVDGEEMVMAIDAELQKQ